MGTRRWLRLREEVCIAHTSSRSHRFSPSSRINYSCTHHTLLIMWVKKIAHHWTHNHDTGSSHTTSQNVASVYQWAATPWMIAFSVLTLDFPTRPKSMIKQSDVIATLPSIPHDANLKVILRDTVKAPDTSPNPPIEIQNSKILARPYETSTVTYLSKNISVGLETYEI